MTITVWIFFRIYSSFPLKFQPWKHVLFHKISVSAVPETCIPLLNTNIWPVSLCGYLCGCVSKEPVYVCVFVWSGVHLCPCYAGNPMCTAREANRSMLGYVETIFFSLCLWLFFFILGDTFFFFLIIIKDNFYVTIKGLFVTIQLRGSVSFMYLY